MRSDVSTFATATVAIEPSSKRYFGLQPSVSTTHWALWRFRPASLTPKVRGFAASQPRLDLTYSSNTKSLPARPKVDSIIIRYSPLRILSADRQPQELYAKLVSHLIHLTYGSRKPHSKPEPLRTLGGSLSPISFEIHPSTAIESLK